MRLACGGKLHKRGFCAECSSRLTGGESLTAASAVGGVVVSETLHYAAKKQADKAYATGYDKTQERRREAAVLALRLHAKAAQPGQQRSPLFRTIAGTANRWRDVPAFDQASSH